MNEQKSVLKIGIAGLGVVGGEVARQLTARGAALGAVAGRELQLVAIAARDRTADRGFDASAMMWVENAADMAAIDELTTAKSEFEAAVNDAADEKPPTPCWMDSASTIFVAETRARA